MPNHIHLKNKVALITGGSRGIGAVTAVTLARAGASIALTYNRSQAEAMSIVSEIRKIGAETIALDLDLQKEKSIRSMVSRTMEKFDRIDILVNNAAVGSATVLKYAEPGSEDRAMVEINILGPILCVQAVLPIMLKQNYGKIITLSSVDGGIVAVPKFRLSDGMSKAAVAFLSKQIVADHPHQGIDAFSICPGATNTQMFRESTLDPISPEQQKELIASLPRGRLIEPQEMADLILFLCSPSASACRGAVIDASLGLGVRPGLISEKK